MLQCEQKLENQDCYLEVILEDITDYETDLNQNIYSKVLKIIHWEIYF